MAVAGVFIFEPPQTHVDRVVVQAKMLSDLRLGPFSAPT